MVPALAESGIRYAVVDDYHFLCTGAPAEALDSFYTTEEDGRTLDLFPISEALRYRLPFSKAAEAVAYLEQLADAGQRAAIYFDDIEKFGIWPETYNWVYERGWLAQFVQGVLASPSIRATTFADYHANSGYKTRGIVYLPTTSYIEMNEWTLPSAPALEYAALIGAEKAAGSYERHKPFLRGGIWRNFLSRYPESNWMHKRMLGLSSRLAALPDSTDRLRHVQLRQLLHRAQSNDAYWHGLFGGLYLPHLRRAIWNNLLALEAALDLSLPRAPFECRDLDCDGCEELILHNAGLQIIVRVDGDAGIIELASYATAHNFGDTLRRYAEGYHVKLGGAASARPQHAEGITSAHDRVSFKHPIEAEDALPDTRPRGICVETLVDSNGCRTAIDGYRLAAASAGGLLFAAECGNGRIEKNFLLDGTGLAVRYRGERLQGYRVEIQLNLAMPSCDGFSGRYILADGSVPCGFGQQLALADLREIILDDGVLHGKLSLSADRPLGLQAAPYFTASQSEAGFEKIMQAACLTLAWQPCGDAETLALKFTVVPSTPNSAAGTSSQSC